MSRGGAGTALVDRHPATGGSGLVAAARPGYNPSQHPGRAEGDQVAEAEHIEQVFARYAAAMAGHDFEGAASLFAPEAVVRDPVDAAPLEGRDQIRGFFSAGATVLQGFALTGPVRIAGDGTRAAAPLQARVDFGDGMKTLDSIDVMTFDEAGLIAAMDAYYGPGNIRDA